MSTLNDVDRFLYMNKLKKIEIKRTMQGEGTISEMFSSSQPS